MLISIKDYAKIHGKSIVTVRQKCQRGGFETAKKVGRDWFIDSCEDYSDHRFKSDDEDKILEKNIYDNYGSKVIGKYYISVNAPCEILDVFGNPLDTNELSFDDLNLLDNDKDAFEEGFNSIIDGYEVFERAKWTIRRKIIKILKI